MLTKENKIAYIITLVGAVFMTMLSFNLGVDHVWGAYMRVQLRPVMASQGIMAQAEVTSCRLGGVMSDITLKYTTTQTQANSQTSSQVQLQSFSFVLASSALCRKYRESELIAIKYLPEYPTLPDLIGEDMVTEDINNAIADVIVLVFCLGSLIKYSPQVIRDIRYKGVTLAKKEEV